MKVLTAVLLLVASVSAGNNVLPPFLTQYVEGQRFFFFPDGNNKLHLVDSQAEEFQPRFNADSQIVLRLFTRKNPTIANIIVNENPNSLLTSTFDRTKPVKIIIHGWNSDGSSKINLLLTEKYLKTLDVNVICLDWGKGANVLYPSSLKNMMKVSTFLASFINWMVKERVPLENIHLMGHSLGAHIAGIASRSISQGRIAYITGFDPALPLVDASKRLSKFDADYVEVIHTNAGNLGIKEACGHNDFYPNGGKSQPGCFLNIACHHSRSYEFFADSLDHTGFMATQCRSVKEATKEKCTLNHSQLHMGGAKTKPELGIFHLETNKKLPFYKG